MSVDPVGEQAQKQDAVSGAELIAAERQRQIDVEGWLPSHDVARHADESLAWAAVAYAAPRPVYEAIPREQDGRRIEPWLRTIWPSNWRRTEGDRVRQLVKAGALIAAEIDRLSS